MSDKQQKQETKMAKAARKQTQQVEQNVEPQIAPPIVEQSTRDSDSGRKNEVKMSMEELESKGLKTKSAVIRFLWNEGYTRSAIAKFMNIRYQHVRNVLITPLKRSDEPSVPTNATNATEAAS